MLGKYRRFSSRPAPSSAGTSPPPQYPGQPSDIRSTLHWLHRASKYRLPEELLVVILHHANYDCLHFVANAEGRNERRSYGPETKAVPYVETKELQYLRDENQGDWTGRIRKVTLRVKGKDQGWASDPRSDSWSWFDVGWTKQAHVAALEGSGDQVKRGPCWAKNPVGGKEWSVHEKTFDMDGDGGESAKMREWIEGLENGHRVSIVPMCRFPGWECHVTEASIDIEVEIWR